MDDVNKAKRISMWWIFTISLITIPIFHYFDNHQLTDADLATIPDLILSEDSQYDPGGGKSSPPSIKFKFTNTNRGFDITYEEFQCVTKANILTDFKKGDTITIKINKAQKSKFYRSHWFSKYSKLYGLSKGGKSYLSLDCRNKVDDKRASA